MEKIGIIQQLLNEYSQKGFDLGVNNKIIDLIEKRKEYDKDLKGEKDREDIDDKMARNFEMKGYLIEIIDYISDNEDNFSFNLVYDDLNHQIREAIGFVVENKKEFENGGIYIKFFSDFIIELSTKRLISLSSFKNKYKNLLLKDGINISDESFYLRIKNELFDLINKLNFDYIYSINNGEIIEEEEGYFIDSELDNEIEMNKANMTLIFDLIDSLYEDKDLVLGDLKKGFGSISFENIKEFLYVNEENINLLMANSIYYSQFLKIITFIDNDGKETIREIEVYMEEELNENMHDKVIINKGYYDEMKEEIYTLVKDLNNLLLIKKTS